jgi:hypothetical protein
VHKTTPPIYHPLAHGGNFLCARTPNKRAPAVLITHAQSCTVIPRRNKLQLRPPRLKSQQPRDCATPPCLCARCSSATPPQAAHDVPSFRRPAHCLLIQHISQLLEPCAHTNCTHAVSGSAASTTAQATLPLLQSASKLLLVGAVSPVVAAPQIRISEESDGSTLSLATTYVYFCQHSPVAPAGCS